MSAVDATTSGQGPQFDCGQVADHSARVDAGDGMRGIVAAGTPSRLGASVRGLSLKVRIAGLLFDLLAVLGSGLLGLLRGQDVSYDLLSYHYSYPWTLFHGGLGSVDPEPFANRFLNPLPELPWYGLEQVFAPKPATFVIALVAGLNLVLLRQVADAVIAARIQGWCRLGLSAAAVALGASGTIFRTELGMSLADVVVSLPLLAGLIAVLRTSRSRRPRVVALFGGLGGGVAVGAKLTMAPYVVGLFAAAALTAWCHRRLRLIVLHAAGLAGGIALAGGAWFYDVWRTTGNPVFPYYNQIFRSRLFPPTALRDTRFGPHGLLDALGYPLYMARGTHRVLDVSVRDPRWLVLCLVLSATGLVLLARLRRPGLATRQVARRTARWVRTREAQCAVAVFFGLASLLWLVQFGGARYAVTSELLTGPVLVGCLLVLLRHRAVLAAGAAAAVCLVMLPWIRLGGYYHVPFTRDRFGVQAAPLRAVPAGSVVIATTTPPSGYLLTYLPRSVERHQVQPWFYGTPLLQSLEDRLKRTPSVYVLTGILGVRAAGVRQNIDLKVIPSSCQAIHSHPGTRYLCRAVWAGR